MTDLRKKAVRYIGAMVIGAAMVAGSVPAMASEGEASSYWAKSFGSDTGNNQCHFIKATSEGGYVFSGVTTSFGAGGKDILLFKIDEGGNLLWAKTYGTSGDDMGRFQAAADGGFVALAEEQSGGSKSYWIMKADSSGSVEWQKCVSSPTGDFRSLQLLCVQDGFVLHGAPETGTTYPTSFFLLKLDSVGNIAWQKSYTWSDTATAAYGTAMNSLSDGSLYLYGAKTSLATYDTDVLLVKLDPNGSIVWQKTFGGPSQDWGMVALPASNGFIVSAYTSSFGAGAIDMWILKVNASGGIEWQNAYGGGGYETGIAQPDSSGGFYLCGSTNSAGSGSQDVELMKLDASGNAVWQRAFGTTGSESGVAWEAPSGGYFVVSDLDSSGTTGVDTWVLKVDSSGSVSWQRTYGGPKKDYGALPHVTEAGDLLITGSSFTGSTDYSLWVVQANPSGDVGAPCDWIHAANGAATTSNLTVTPTNAVVGSPSFISSAGSLTLGGSSVVSQTASLPSTTICSGGGSTLAASASASPTSGDAPLAVAFTGAASGGTEPYTYAWDFGDGDSSTAQSPSHTYSAASDYTVTLTVHDSASQTASDNHLAIHVTPGPCTAPSITAQPQNQTITSGQSAALSVAASGTSPFAYQWYQGTSGDTSNAVGGATGGSYTTPGLTATTSYWVKVSNSCGFANSNTATITVDSSCYTLSTGTNPGGVGSVTVNTGQNCSGGYTHNTGISLTANTPSGYTFSGWSGSGGNFSSTTSNPTIFTITGNATVTARFSTPGGVFSQQGPKLVGSGAVGNAAQGLSVSLSADGNTAIVGGAGDNGNAGAAWVWTRSGGVWIQQGTKLVASGTSAGASQGFSGSLSADGNTAIVGGPNYGAWVWTRSGGVWTQQGTNLFGSDIGGNSQSQGWSVSLSADGNTAIVGGPFADSQAGAAWVWTRNGGVWTQQGPKLVGTGAVGNAFQGYSVSLSADGNTAIVGGMSDNSGAGAAWVWTRSGGVWTQQGTKLVGSGAVGTTQGSSVSLSADGNTAIVGGATGFTGAVWVWTRSGGVWTQQGTKLVGSGAVGNAAQGLSVSLSADGNTALVGGPEDNSSAGAAWVWTRSGGVWTQQGTKLVGSGVVGNANQGHSVSLSADGNTAIVGGPEDNSNAGTAWVFVTTGCATMTLTPTSLPGGMIGSIYDQTISATGGISPYSYAVATGSLPGGLSLNSGGKLSGTPTASGTFTFTISAMDSKGCAGSQTYTLSIGASHSPVVLNMVKMGGPFRVEVNGSNFQSGIRVYIDGSSTEWSPVAWKSATKVVIKGGAALKAAVPKGTIKTFRFMNPDGGEASITWGW